MSKDPLSATYIPGKFIRGLQKMNRKQRRDWVKKHKDEIQKEIENEQQSKVSTGPKENSGA